VSKDLNPEKALIFRIVHKDNMPAVWENGCQCRNEAKGKYVDIGNLELISKRNSRVVPCGPGGTLGDYVPFYFTLYTPMLYNIKTGCNGFPKKPMADIVILTSSLHKLKSDGVAFVFSDRHAYLKTALFSDDLTDLTRIIWPTLQARNFRKDDVALNRCRGTEPAVKEAAGLIAACTHKPRLERRHRALICAKT